MSAFLPPALAPLPNIDKRMDGDHARRLVSAKQQAAVEQLRARLPQAHMDFDPVSGSPKSVSARDGFLTGPTGKGAAISAASLARFPGDPHQVTKAFVQEHRDLFGHGPEALAQARIKRDYVTAHNRLHTVVWEQQVDGIPVFQAVLISHTTSKGELVNISSQFVPNPDAAATRGTPNRAAMAAGPDVSPRQAVALAAQNVGENLKVEAVSASGEAMAGPEQRHKFQAPGLKGEADAKLIWLPTDKDTLRLCWDVTLMSRQRGEMFRVLVDARTGEVFVRQCLTQYISDASYRVFTSDSPSPFSPGYPTPMTNQPPLVARSLVTLSALDTNASPAGWINDGENETRGNNVDAHTDRNADNTPDLPRPQGSPFRVFDFAMDLTTQDPTNYSPAAVVQLFYLCNWYHDRLYELGFTEAAGNFQSDNFGRGGLGNDAVQADAQDGSGNNNANFSTPPDGSPGRMQMYIFTGSSPRRDGDFDAEIVLHEHTHGLSWRLVGGGQALGTLQSDGMGEGWSDFYGITLLSEEGDNLNGNYATAAYASYKLNPTYLQNYYFGIRRFPYTTDLTRNPLTFNDLDPAQVDFCSSGAPYSPVSFLSPCGGNADEVHNEGEVWCVTLWEARANLINKYGWAVGNHLILQLVTDGMKLTPPQPNFLQARDAIIQADLVDNGGANRDELWAAFAKRGMGFSAISPSSSTTSGVYESFDLPDDLRIAPLTGLVASGPVSGPFSPNSVTFTLTNTGSNSLNWTVNNTNAWLDVLPAGGTLAPGGPAALVTASVNATSDSLPIGIYPGTVWFTNLSNQASFRRQVALRVGQPDYYTELFDPATNDLAFQMFTFTPDGSTSFYSACRQPATAFPTDPGGGTTVTLTDDSFSQVTLSGGSTVAIYRNRTNVFYIGSNGYLTMNSGDSSYLESFAAHFNRPRVSALFDDLVPDTGSTISWKQLGDRVAVTYLAVPEYGSSSQTNSFQIELFFDGRIRLTYLDIKALDGLAGLSPGLGVPASFAQSDLSTYGACSPLTLLLPYSAIENSGILTNAGSVWLNAALPANLVISLTSSVPSRITVPPTTTITAGQTSSRFDLTIVDNAIQDGDQPVLVTASAPGLTNISTAILIVDDDTSPVITTHPKKLTVATGGAATFSVTATGQTPLSYFWMCNSALIPGANASSFTTSNVPFSASGSQFSCLVSNAFGTAVSSNAVLTVMAAPPNDQCGNAILISSSTYTNTQSTTNATSTGDPVPSCVGGFGKGVWYAYTPTTDGKLVVDTVGSSFDTGLGVYTGTCNALTQVGCNDDSGGSLISRVTNSATAGTTYYILAGGYSGVSGDLVFHLAFTLPQLPPAITAQPLSQAVLLGGNATFNVTATGSAPVNYFWERNGAPVTGAEATTYSTNHVQLPDDGSLFSCLVSNAYGSITSRIAVLTVTTQLVVGISGTGNFDEFNAIYGTLTNLGFAVQSVSNGNWGGVNVVVSYPGCDPSTYGPSSSEISNGVRFVQISSGGSGWTPNTSASVMEGTNLTVSLDVAHPITSGLPASWTARGWWRYGDVGNDYVGWSTDAALPSLASETSVVNQSRVMVANSFGNGKAVYIGWNVYGPDAGTNDLAVLRKAISWAGGATDIAPVFMPGTLALFTNGQFQFTLAGVDGFDYEILVSTNLSDWNSLATLLMTNGASVFLDSNTNAIQRFYRARLAP